MESRVLHTGIVMIALATSSLFSSTSRAQPTDLIISEYVEGSSLDKAIELYNGTGSSIDLSDYQLELYPNGSTVPSTSVTLVGTLPSGAAYVLANPGASFGGVDLATNVISHNGNDAYVLRFVPDDGIVDLFGRVGSDPGTEWPAPNGGTQDNTLRRRETVCSGAEPVDAPFDGADEWDGFGNGEFSGLGSHTINCLVAINEVLADPPAGEDVNGDGSADTAEDEFVELINLSAGEVDLSGWLLSDASGLRHTFPLGTVIPSGCGVVVFGGGTPVGDFGGMTVQTASEGGLGLNNGGETITLESKAGTVAALTWGGEGGNDQSLTRDPDITGAFVQHTTAPASDGRAYSPGTRISGPAFEACRGDGVFADRFEQAP